jgi:hypothetical protein
MPTADFILQQLRARRKTTKNDDSVDLSLDENDYSMDDVAQFDNKQQKSMQTSKEHYQPNRNTRKSTKYVKEVEDSFKSDLEEGEEM